MEAIGPHRVYSFDIYSDEEGGDFTFIEARELWIRLE